MSPYLKLDLEASLVAEKLRDYSDADLERIPTLSPPHLGLLCSKLKTHKQALFKAAGYELHRRKAMQGKTPL